MYNNVSKKIIYAIGMNILNNSVNIHPEFHVQLMTLLIYH